MVNSLMVAASCESPLFLFACVGDVFSDGGVSKSRLDGQTSGQTLANLDTGTSLGTFSPPNPTRDTKQD